MTLALGQVVVGDDDRVRQLARALMLAEWPRDHDVLQAYYDGEVRLAALGWSLPPNMSVLTTVINWPGLIVNSTVDRMEVQGFRLAGGSKPDERLQEWWQENKMDGESRLGFADFLAKRRCYITIGGPDDDQDAPVMTFESATDIYAAMDRRRRTVSWAVRRPYDVDVLNPAAGQAAVLYTTDETVHYRTAPSQFGWQVADVVQHNLGVVPVVPLVNRQDLSAGDIYGRSDMADVMGITDAACRSLTNLQGAQELLAVPTRYVLGATAADFIGKDGKAKTTWEIYLGRMLALGDADTKIGQLPAADLRNFTEVLTAYGKLASSVTGLPPHYLGYSSDNPASADAITGSEVRLVMRAEHRQTRASDPLETAQRIALKMMDGEEVSARIETVWANAATPTFAAKADATVKLYGAGLIPRSAAWDALGYSQEQQAQMAAELADDPFNALMRSVGDPATAGSAGTVPPASGAVPAAPTTTTPAPPEA